MTRKILSPCDLEKLPEGERVLVGGRVRRHPKGTWQVADALSTVPVNGTEAPEEGMLVLVEATWNHEALNEARVIEVHAVLSSSQRESARLLDQGVGKNLQLRAKVLRSIRGWFDDRDFLEVETPQRVPSPGLDLHLDAFEAEGSYLITSPEYQMKRLLVGGLPRIYQLVHCFRAGERGDDHNSEFLMLEWYRAFSGIDDVIRDTEELIATVARMVSGKEVLRRGDRWISVTPPFHQLSVMEAFAKHAGLEREAVLELAESDEEQYFRILVDRVEPALASLPHAVVLRDFPSVHASLARRRPDDPRLCERFEVYVGGVELCNGFGELTDAREQRFRLERDHGERRRVGKPVYPIDERFLKALEEGMPPSGGNALGVDRLIGLCAGVKKIGSGMAFPDDWV